MHSMDFYVSTCRYVMQADPDNPESWSDLYRLLPCLRQSLCCYVCFNLVLDPMGPTHNECKHAVCRKCLGGKMKLKPSCSWCKDHSDFEPNTLLKILVACFRKLCLYINNSPIRQHIANLTVNGESNSLINILKEAREFEDNYVPRSSVIPVGKVPVSKHVVSTSKQLHVVNEEESVNLKPGCSSDNDRAITAAQAVLISEQEKNILSLKEAVILAESPLRIKQTTLEKRLKRSSHSDSDENESFELPESFHLKSSKTEDDFEKNNKLPIQERKSQKNKPSDSHDGNDIYVQQESPHHKENNKRMCNKTVVFMKRATQDKKKRKLTQYLKRKAIHQSKDQKFISKKKPVFKLYREAPIDLVRIDNNYEPTAKKMKQDLCPPELKPLSFCKCGKAGNSNRLTCLGQRCPCYSMKLPCIGCKCRGCRNPKKGPQGQNDTYSHAVLRSERRSLN